MDEVDVIALAEWLRTWAAQAGPDDTLQGSDA